MGARTAPLFATSVDACGALIPLLESSARLCLLVEASGRILAASKQAAAHGLQVNGADPSSFFDLLAPIDRDQVVAEIANQTVSNERRLTLSVAGRPLCGTLHGVNGSCGGAAVFIAAADEFESRGAVQGEVEALRHQVEILKAAFEASFDGLYVSDGQGKILLTNRSYERATGWAPAAIVGTRVAELLEKGMIDRSATMEAIRKGGPVTSIVQVRGGNRLITTANPVSDEKGVVQYVVGNARRISDLLPIEAHWLPFMSKRADDARKGEDLRLWNAFVATQNGGRDGSAFVGDSAAFREAVAAGVRAAEVDTPVLIMGESGVGKGLLANLIHRMSRRRAGPFIEVNCGAIPETLLESELFGYEKGAFTDARSDGKRGLIEAANRGTLFLDEISELPVPLQVKLLKFLDNMSFTPLGGVTRRTVDVKIVAASNVDLEQHVAASRFRQDLYFRLNVLPITIAPLRERREDIPLLVEYFLKVFEKRYGKVKRISSEALIGLMHNDYTGNVRELRNVIERLCIMTPGETIEFADLPASLRVADAECASFEGTNLRKLVREYEKRIIESAVRRYRTTYDAAAALGVNQSTIVRKLQSYRDA